MDRAHPLRNWRLSRKPRPMTQTELGESVGVSASQISLLENGERGCSLETAVKIRDLTGIPVESLTRREAAA